MSSFAIDHWSYGGQCEGHSFCQLRIDFISVGFTHRTWSRSRGWTKRTRQCKYSDFRRSWSCRTTTTTTTAITRIVFADDMATRFVGMHESMRNQLCYFIAEESVPAILPIDYNTLLENIRELNVLAGESEMHFEPQNRNNQRNISTLKRVEPINITIYANGIFLFNGPFRSFSGRIFFVGSICHLVVSRTFDSTISSWYSRWIFPNGITTTFSRWSTFQCRKAKNLYWLILIQCIVGVW